MAKHGLSEDEVGDLKEAFGMFDIDGDGKFFRRGRGDILATNLGAPDSIFMMF